MCSCYSCICTCLLLFLRVHSRAASASIAAHSTDNLFTKYHNLHTSVFRMLDVTNESLFNMTANSYVIFIISIYCHIACIACMPIYLRFFASESKTSHDLTLIIWRACKHSFSRANFRSNTNFLAVLRNRLDSTNNLYITRVSHLD